VICPGLRVPEFQTARSKQLKIHEGGNFTLDNTDTKQPVTIVNANFAHKHWGNQSVLGHQVRIFNPGKEQLWWTIVGVTRTYLSGSV
jgi:hypothetical protein